MPDTHPVLLILLPFDTISIRLLEKLTVSFSSFGILSHRRGGDARRAIIERLRFDAYMPADLLCKPRGGFTFTKETRVQDGLDSSKTGGAEPLPISEAWGHIADESDPSSQLEEGIEQTNLRKLPLCQVIVKNPLGQLWLVGKNILQGARNGR